MIAISQKYKNIYNNYICFSKYIFYCDTYIYILIYQLERKKVPYIFICFIHIYTHRRKYNTTGLLENTYNNNEPKKY